MTCLSLSTGCSQQPRSRGPRNITRKSSAARNAAFWRTMFQFAEINMWIAEKSGADQLNNLSFKNLRHSETIYDQPLLSENLQCRKRAHGLLPKLAKPIHLPKSDKRTSLLCGLSKLLEKNPPAQFLRCYSIATSFNEIREAMTSAFNCKKLAKATILIGRDFNKAFNMVKNTGKRVWNKTRMIPSQMIFGLQRRTTSPIGFQEHEVLIENDKEWSAPMISPGLFSFNFHSADAPLRTSDVDMASYAVDFTLPNIEAARPILNDDLSELADFKKISSSQLKSAARPCLLQTQGSRK